eukprot:gene45789-56042_t
MERERRALLIDALDHCPCASISRINSTRDDSGRKVCVVLPSGELSTTASIKTSISASITEEYRKIVFVDETNSQSTQCLVTINVVTGIALEDWRKKRWLCPGSCSPVPRASIPLELLTLNPQAASFAGYSDIALSCSVNAVYVLQQYKQHMSANAAFKRILWAQYLLSTLANRVVLECSEHWSVLSQEHGVTIHDDLSTSSPTTTLSLSHVLPRRKVHAVVIWIGNTERYSRILHQHESLREASFHDQEA